jgi:gluconate 2-dehydrogenase subunit 3-like protein
MTFISRRDLLKGIAATTPVARAFQASDRAFQATGRAFQASDHGGGAGSPEGLALQAIGNQREPLESLTASEMDILEAIVARLIPTDENGPGAREARAAHYIDRALGSALASSRQAYTAGLAAVDQYARSSRGARFSALSPEAQDALLTDIEKGTATGFTGSSTAFFNLVLSHTHQGTFGDPYYGGNAHSSAGKSAYDYDGFTKTSGD